MGLGGIERHMVLLKMSVALIQQPLWWITVLLWRLLITFTVPIHTFRRWYRRSFLQWGTAHRQKEHTVKTPKQEELPSTVYILDGTNERFPLFVPQIATAFELPFQSIGVRTEEHRQEIEEAISALYRLNPDQEALSLCLQRLLEAAKQNWVDLAAFSPREQEILELLLQDVTYKEMSSRLHVSSNTIKTHIYHIFQKLQVSNRHEAVRIIHKRGWFYIPTPLSTER